nr:phosphate-starvation-inducible PsiE family protein [Candidatus Planktophila sulfonica]
MTIGVPLTMAKEEKDRVETSILPLKYVDLVEDIFHAVLAIALFAIGVGAFFFSIKRLLETAPFFPNGMIQGVNDILFIVIILEILRTVISRFTDGVYQLDKFLIIGVIAAVRHILTVGASLTLESGKSDTAFERAIYEMGLNALIVVALVFAIFMSKSAHRKAK